MRNAQRLSVPRESSWLVISVLLAAGFQPTELEAQRRNRDSWQRVPDVVAALAIGEGSRVADVGAGSGYFTEHLAREVGAGGRVFAVEISERSLSQLRRLAEDENLDNIEVVPGEVDDPKLPERSLDAVLVVDAYHEMTEYEAMLSGMYRALKPGGRLVIVDHVPSRSHAIGRPRATS
jgi:ubiquinone/menaquinone biosynthesis C-methylase UbiE